MWEALWSKEQGPGLGFWRSLTLGKSLHLCLLCLSILAFLDCKLFRTEAVSHCVLIQHLAQWALPYMGHHRQWHLQCKSLPNNACGIWIHLKARWSPMGPAQWEQSSFKGCPSPIRLFVMVGASSTESRTSSGCGDRCQISSFTVGSFCCCHSTRKSSWQLLGCPRLTFHSIASSPRTQTVLEHQCILTVNGSTGAGIQERLSQM